MWLSIEVDCWTVERAGVEVTCWGSEPAGTDATGEPSIEANAISLIGTCETDV